MALTSAERQKAHRAKKKQDGLVPVTIMVPAHIASDLKILAAFLNANQWATVGPPKNAETGRLVKMR